MTFSKNFPGSCNKILRKRRSKCRGIWGQTEERNATSESSSGINRNQSCNKNIDDASPFCSIPSIRVNFPSELKKDLTVLIILKAFASTTLFLQNSTKKTSHTTKHQNSDTQPETEISQPLFSALFHHCMLFLRSFWSILIEQRLS